MYLCYSIEESKVKGRASYHRTMYQRYEWKVVLNAAGVPVWAFHTKGYWTKGYSLDGFKSLMARRMKKREDHQLPLIQTAAPGKKVLKSEAMKLTGMTLGHAALDFLTENVNADDGVVSNFVKS